jgi:hypothetical protein
MVIEINNDTISEIIMKIIIALLYYKKKIKHKI